MKHNAFCSSGGEQLTWHVRLSPSALGPWNSRYTGDDYRLFRLLLGILLLAATLALIAKLARSGIRVQPHRIKSHAAILLFYIGTAAGNYLFTSFIN